MGKRKGERRAASRLSYVEYLGISNACLHTAAAVKVQCLEYVDEFIREPLKVSIFSRVTHSG